MADGVAQKRQVDEYAQKAFESFKKYADSCVAGTCNPDFKKQFLAVVSEYGKKGSTKELFNEFWNLVNKNLEVYRQYNPTDDVAKRAGFAAYLEKTAEGGLPKILPGITNAGQLAKEATKLSGLAADLYNDGELGGWLQGKLGDYNIRDLQGLAENFAKAVKRGNLKKADITEEKLDRWLHDNEFSLQNYLVKRVTFSFEDVASKLLRGDGDGIQALKLKEHEIGGDFTNEAINKGKDREYEQTRVKTVQKLLQDLLRSDEPNLSGIRKAIKEALGPTNKIIANGDLSKAERDAIQNIREYLIGFSNDSYEKALPRIGMESIGNDSTARMFTHDLARALALYLALAKRGKAGLEEEVKKLGGQAAGPVEPAIPMESGKKAAEAPKPAVPVEAPKPVAKTAYDGIKIASNALKDISLAIADSGLLLHSIAGDYTGKNAKTKAEQERVRAVQILFNMLQEKPLKQLDKLGTFESIIQSSPNAKELAGFYDEKGIFKGGAKEDGVFDDRTKSAIKILQNFLNRQARTDGKYKESVKALNSWIGNNGAKLLPDNKGDKYYESYRRETLSQAKTNPDKIYENGEFTLQTLLAYAAYAAVKSDKPFMLPAAAKILEPREKPAEPAQKQQTAAPVKEQAKPSSTPSPQPTEKPAPKKKQQPDEEEPAIKF